MLIFFLIVSGKKNSTKKGESPLATRHPPPALLHVGSITADPLLRAASSPGRAGPLAGPWVARSAHSNDTITIDHEKYNKYAETFVTKF